MATIIALIERIPAACKVTGMPIFTGDQGRQAIAELHPLEGSHAAGRKMWISSHGRSRRRLVQEGWPLVIQVIDTDTFVAQAQRGRRRRRNALCRGRHGAGADATAVRPRRPPRQLFAVDELAESIEAGDERTFRQDPQGRHPPLGWTSPSTHRRRPSTIPMTAVQVLHQVPEDSSSSRLGRR